MNAKLWKTAAASAERLAELGTFAMEYNPVDAVEGQDHSGDVEGGLINVHPSVEYQPVVGIGGAFTESAATVWQRLPAEKQAELIEAYFSREKGIGYSFGRLSMGSCDFSLEDYTYVQEGDRTLGSFDISHDEKAIFPMVRAAQKYGALTLFASPWSPPAYMKTSGSRIGGRLKKECYPLWAKYFRKYVEACAGHGVPIWGVTMQNEPRHHQLWESCLYSAEEESAFLGYLGPALDGTGVKILCYDHCRERVIDRADAVIGGENGRYCAGIAHHWYSGEYFGDLRAFAAKYPGKLCIASESCAPVRGKGINAERELEIAERYGRDLWGCFSNGVHAYCDWNLILDENGGPSHNRENRLVSADAPVFGLLGEGRILYRLAYYYIGHYSKFVRPGARVIASSSCRKELEATAFKNPDGTLVCVILNRSDGQHPCRIRIGGHLQRVDMAPHSIVTAVIAG